MAITSIKQSGLTGKKSKDLSTFASPRSIEYIVLAGGGGGSANSVRGAGGGGVLGNGASTGGSGIVIVRYQL